MARPDHLGYACIFFCRSVDERNFDYDLSANGMNNILSRFLVQAEIISIQQDLEYDVTDNKQTKRAVEIINFF